MSTPFAEVIGLPVAHSKSPLIHGSWLAELGLDGRYERTAVTSEALPTFLAGRRTDQDWRGCNVTIPHKQAVLPLVDRLDPGAERIGAVNTIVRDETGELVGYNTDGIGFLEPLRTILRQHHLLRMARIVGTGGAALAIADALAGEGFVLVIIGRDVAKAEALAGRYDEGRAYAANLASFGRPTDFVFDDRSGCLDLLVNATSLGMAGQPPLVIDWSHVPPGAIVDDIVYAPLETPLLAEARRRGHPTIDGLSMLIGQAAAAFELFFGMPAPRAHDAALRARLLA